ncbi:MAG: ApaG protein [Halieaceae bacterium]|jgi:ApaG protein
MDNSAVTVAVVTQYLSGQSDPEQLQFAFAYTITISNSGEEAVQLLSRHWIITDANASVQEVKGDGVIGEQPVILPGESFTYTSGAMLNTGIGAMEGSYTMLLPSGDTFEAPVQAFSLHQPGTLH